MTITDKITHLLEKAQSTEFEAEAQTFYAKAQELMRKYAIEEASLWAERGKDETPEIREFKIGGKRTAGLDGIRTLLHACAKHNRCRMWYTPGAGTAHIAGFKSDLDYVEVLFNSLRLFGEDKWLWASIESTEHHRSFDAGFWDGFGTRIYHRFAEQERLDREQSKGTDLVLVDRSKAIDRHMLDQGIRLHSGQGSSNRSSEGRKAGSKAGNEASLNPRNSLGGRKEIGH